MGWVHIIINLLVSYASRVPSFPFSRVLIKDEVRSYVGNLGTLAGIVDITVPGTSAHIQYHCP